MKVRFFCTEVHGGGAWKRFDFTVQGGGTDCPQGTAVLYATDQGDFLAFEPGKMYEIHFQEVRDEQSQVREEPEAPGVLISPVVDSQEGGDLEGPGGSDLGVLVPERESSGEERQPSAETSEVTVDYIPKRHKSKHPHKE